MEQKGTGPQRHPCPALPWGIARPTEISSAAEKSSSCQQILLQCPPSASASLKPDILLLDLRMPVKNGLAVLEKVNFDKVPTRVIVLTASEDERDVVRAMRLGARGAVLKQSAAGVLIKCIQHVHAGEIWLENRITAEVINAFSRSDSGPRRGKAVVSDREKEIVRLVTQGLRNKEIGVRLFISEQTVKNHLHNIFDKLGVSDRLELALYAIHHGLVTKP